MQFNADLNRTNPVPKIQAAAPAQASVKREKVRVIPLGPSEDEEANEALLRRSKRVEELAFVSLDSQPRPTLERDPNAPTRIFSMTQTTDGHDNTELARIVDGYPDPQN